MGAATALRFSCALAALRQAALAAAEPSAAASVPSAGCGLHKLPPGVTKGALSRGLKVHVADPLHPQGERRYRLFVPGSYRPGAPAPLVLDFHGFYDSAPSEAKEDGVSIAAEREGFIIAYPNGLEDNPKDPHDWWGQWNGGGTNGTGGGGYGKRTCIKNHSPYPCYETCARAGLCKGGSTRHDCGCSGCADDTGFVAVLLAALKAELCVDTTRVHGTGMSNGAIFLYHLATHPVVGPQLASIVPVEGSFLLGFLEKPKVSMPVMDIHGTKDDCVPANVSNSWGKYKHRGCPLRAAGHKGCAVGDDGFLYHPMPDILRLWSVVNGCPERAMPEPVRTPHDGHTKWSCMHPHGRRCKSTILSCTHSLGHTWPFNEGRARVRTAEFGEVMWDFMRKHQRWDAAAMATNKSSSDQSGIFV